jgi:SHS2 domain-containing protein
VSPLELTLDLTPRGRLDVIDVRAQAAARYGDVFETYHRCLYCSLHTTAGYLPQSFASRLGTGPQAVRPYIDLFTTVFPEGAGYLHDELDLRSELTPEQRPIEPTNADSHLAFIGSGLRSCVSYVTRRPGPVSFIDLDGVNAGRPRRRTTTLVGYDTEVEVARATLHVPVSATHPVDAVNLKEARLGLYDQLVDLIAAHGVEKGRVRLELASGEQFASLTVNEYETLLMRHDLAEVLKNPLRFAAQKAKHAWDDPRAVPSKTIDYAKYDLVRALNRLVDALGLAESAIERVLAQALAVPASRFLRMKRSVDLLVSDSKSPGQGAVIEGPYQAPIMVQWRRAAGGERQVNVTLTRFV